MSMLMPPKPPNPDPASAAPDAATCGERAVEPLIFEKSVPGQRAVDLPPTSAKQRLAWHSRRPKSCAR